MSDSNRSELVALVAVACTVIVFLIGLAAGLGYPSGEQVAASRYEQVEANPRDNVSEAVASSDDFNFWRDTFPQWAMAVFAAAATGVSVWAVRLLADTLEATRDAVGVTRELGQIQVRAYVFCEKIILEWAEGNIEHVVFIWKNTGQSPARSTATKASFSIVRPPVLVDALDEATIAEIENSQPTKDGAGFMAAGGDIKVMTPRISADIVEEWRRGECAILAHGIVKYTDEFRAQRFSRCCFRLVYEDTPTRHVTHFERLGFGNSYE